MIIHKKERTYRAVDFAVPTDHRIKLKECEKRDKYLDPAIPIVIGAFGTVTKGLVQGLEDLEKTEQVETVQNTALLRSARILRRVLET